jgi:uncharacterized protein (TIGR02145 family)
MKSTLKISIVILTFFLLTTCKKEKVPVVVTNEIINITGTTATSGGNITDEGTGTVISRGICWSSGINPSIADSKTSDGAGAGSFSSNLNGLNGASTYFVRAYATNSAGTGYGMVMSFTTLGASPAPANSAATNMTTNSATINGSVNPNYLSTIVIFEYGTTTSYGNIIEAVPSPLTGSTLTTVSASITNLTPGTTYHYRIKATNSLGTKYSDDIVFSTLGNSPAPANSAPTNITTNSATINGSVNPNYLSTNVIFEYGTSTSYGNTIAAVQSPLMGSTLTTVSAAITNLTPGTTYHYRIKATNSLGANYSDDIEFSTLGKAPSVTTIASESITSVSAQLKGSVNPNYVLSEVIFEYGTTTNYSSSITAAQSPVAGSTITIVSANIVGLSPRTQYHYRIKAINSLGTSYGNDMTFTTSGNLPTAITLSFSNISETSARLNATVNPNFLSTTIYFEFGTNTSYGSVVTASQSPLTGSTNTNTSATITGLTAGVEYHFRVKAENQLGISYGQDMTFMTSGLLLDYDGNQYNTVVIGTQTWMAENLKTIHYNDGSEIPLVSNSASWAGALSGAYCTFGFNAANLATYGALYNWYSVNTGKLCPVGWHVPTDIEWLLLTTNLGGSSVAGGKMKETGTTHWVSPNTGADNSSGFTALGGSTIDYNGVSAILGQTAYWWSSTGVSSTFAFANKLFYNNATISQGGGVTKLSGCSVRCIKD